MRKRKLKRDARILKNKAIASLRRGLTAFNSFEDDGRVTAVLLHLQHSAEMVLKAGLVQSGGCKMFEKSDKSIGFGKCLNHAPEKLKSPPSECGVFRTIDAMRDNEQHWYAVVPEELLFTECRAFVTAIDDLLLRVFGERLADHLPQRILPISTHAPPTDMRVFFDSEFTQIGRLLAPGKRRRDEAVGRIRTLLALEAHTADEVSVTERDVRRVEKAARDGKGWAVVFPRLAQVTTTIAGEGATLVVRISKGEGVPVRIVGDGDDVDAAAIREVDVLKRFRYSPSELASKLELAPAYASALKKHLKIDEDARCCYEVSQNKQKLKRYSDEAIVKMRAALKDGVDPKGLYRESQQGRPSRRGGLIGSP